MILYPNAKINIGLKIQNKRPDGFHNILSLFYPVNLTDILEFLPANDSRFEFTQSGIFIEGSSEDNLCIKVYRYFQKHFKISPLKIHLHKNIPTQAGLGGGSSDAAFFIKGINDFFELGLPINELKDIALIFGSDCPFFIENKPVIATGRGEILKSVNLDLSPYHIVIVKPSISVSTAKAYASIMAKKENFDFQILSKIPIANWKQIISNDFEVFAFKNFPELKKIKENLFNMGALFAQMTGSGSAIYGIFDKFPYNAQELFPDCLVFKSRTPL